MWICWRPNIANKQRKVNSLSPLAETSVCSCQILEVLSLGLQCINFYTPPHAPSHTGPKSLLSDWESYHCLPWSSGLQMQMTHINNFSDSPVAYGRSWDSITIGTITTQILHISIGCSGKSNTEPKGICHWIHWVPYRALKRVKFVHQGWVMKDSPLCFNYNNWVYSLKIWMYNYYRHAITIIIDMLHHIFHRTLERKTKLIWGTHW